jgi:hypothetical protein
MQKPPISWRFLHYTKMKSDFFKPNIPLVPDVCALTCALDELILLLHAPGAQKAFHKTVDFSFRETHLRVAFSS